MNYSFAQPATLTCPQCGTTFDVEVWLIVDTAARPDLLARIRADHLHILACPNAHDIEVNVPLLLYRSAEHPPLLFTPARGATDDETWEDAQALISHFRGSAGEVWHDIWLEQLALVPREKLALALSDETGALLRQMLEEASQARQAAGEAGPADQRQESNNGSHGAHQLNEALRRFVQAFTWDESRAILEEQPGLLGEEIDPYLDELGRALRDQGHIRDADRLDDHRTLLARAREVGIDQAFAEKTGESSSAVAGPVSDEPLVDEEPAESISIPWSALDLTSVEAVREYAEFAIQLLERLRLKPYYAGSLRDDISDCLGRSDPSRSSTVSDCIERLNMLLAEVGIEAAIHGLRSAQQGALQRAAEELALALSAAELLDDNTIRAYGLLGMGLVHKRRNNYLPAEKLYRQAIDVADSIGNLMLKSGALDNLGNMYISMGQVATGIACYEQSLDIARQAGDVDGELAVLNNLGAAYMHRGDVKRAADTFHQIIERGHATGRFAAEAIGLDNLATTLMVEENFAEAEQARLRSLELYSTLELPYDEYIVLIKLSELYMRMEQTERAGQYFERAADLIRRLRDDIDIDRYTVYRKRALDHMERTGKATLESELRTASEADEEASAKVNVALHIGLGMFMGEQHFLSGSEKLERGEYEAAERDLKLALAAYRDIGAYSEETGVASDLGVLHMELGNPEEAQRWLLHARQLAHTLGDWRREVNILVNLSRLYLDYQDALGRDEPKAFELLTEAELLLERFPEIIKWWLQRGAEQAVEEKQDTEAIAGADIVEHQDMERMSAEEYAKGLLVYSNLGNRHANHGSFTRAEDYYIKAVEAAQQSWASTHHGAYRVIYRLVNLFQLYHRTGANEKLERTIERMQEFIKESGDPVGEFAFAVRVAQYYQDTEGASERAYTLFKRAIDVSNVLRDRVPRGSKRITFIGYREPPFGPAVALALQLGRPREAFDLVARAKSRQLLDALSETLPPPAGEMLRDRVEHEREVFSRWMKETAAGEAAVPDDPQQDFLQRLYRSSEAVPELRNELDRIWDELDEVLPEYVALRRGSPLEYSEVRKMLVDM